MPSQPTVETKGQHWTRKEHQLFLECLKFRPEISWIQVAEKIGTRSPRQVRTHAQKHFQKVERQKRNEERKLLQEKLNTFLVSSSTTREGGLYKDIMPLMQPDTFPPMGRIEMAILGSILEPTLDASYPAYCDALLA